MTQICKNCYSQQVTIVRDVYVTPSKFKSALCYCETCDFLFINDISWIDSAYNIGFYGDTGYAQRNLIAARLLKILFMIYAATNPFPKSFVGCDIGTGIGLLPRLLRDAGYNFYGLDQYASMQLIAPFISNGQHATVKTSFEVVEHIHSLPEFLATYLDSNTELFLFSTCFRKDNVIPSNDWWYYALQIGQHISFHSKSSFEYALRIASINPISFHSLGSSIYAISFSRQWSNALAVAAILVKCRLLPPANLILSTFFSRPSLCEADHQRALSRL